MPCFKPLTGYRSKDRNPSGKRSIVFNPNAGLKDLPLSIPCGQCGACRLERSRKWAVRCIHEASLHKDNSFITLTYDEEHLPKDHSLHKEDFQKFMKRLRKHFRGRKVGVFYCGEYGDQKKRPHFHACLFNCDFSDKEIVGENHRQEKYYESQCLNRLWKKGKTIIGDVTFNSAAYVARYITKKITGKQAHLHYELTDYTTGEVFELTPEFAHCSRNPGIGINWYNKHKADLYPDDFVLVNGKKVRIPRFYDEKYEAEHPETFAKIKARRHTKGEQQKENNTPDRLRVREELFERKLILLKRNFENEG